MHNRSHPEICQSKVGEVGQERAHQDINGLQVVIYLARTGAAFPELEMRSCEQYALAFGWNVTLTVVDDETGKPPQERHLLLAVLQAVRGRGAEAVLVPSRATISPIDGEFDEFAGEIEKAGGFIQVTRR
ncbi:hypothetical protein [Kitasatospora sp. NPDC089509]|uniref:hypothetical protein n=1 Tax=Kitasatospora sp. NPDC089509 TaxID=3364079 RepID=UPI00381792C9